MVAVDDLNNPRQMVEPFALLDILLESDKLNLDGLQVDLLDISPDVIGHINFLKTLAEQKKTGITCSRTQTYSQGKQNVCRTFQRIGKKHTRGGNYREQGYHPFLPGKEKDSDTICNPLKIEGNQRRYDNNQFQHPWKL